MQYLFGEQTSFFRLPGIRKIKVYLVFRTTESSNAMSKEQRTILHRRKPSFVVLLIFFNFGAEA